MDVEKRLSDKVRQRTSRTFAVRKKQDGVFVSLAEKDFLELKRISAYVALHVEQSLDRILPTLPVVGRA
jgi:hypothetical protein